MPLETTLHNELGRLFSENMNLDAPSAETDLLESGFMDSLTFVELLLHLEKKFGIQISLDDLEIETSAQLPTLRSLLLVKKERTRNAALGEVVTGVRPEMKSNTDRAGQRSRGWGACSSAVRALLRFRAQSGAWR